MSTFNGIGTKLYGSTDFESDGSYVTTKWFVIVYLPIFPLESLRVIKEGSTTLILYNSIQYRSLQVPMHKKQIIKTYCWAYGIVAAIILLANIF